MKTKTAKNVLHKIIFLLCPSRVSRHSIIEFTTILKRGLCWNIFFFHAFFLSTAFNAYSQITFQKTYAESSMRSPKSIQQTSDGGYILTGYGLFGSSKAEAYLLKVDADGVIEWTKLYGDGTSGLDNQYGNRVRQTNDGGYIVTGYTDGFGVAVKDIYVFKTDSVGNLEWAKTFGGSGEERGESVYQNADGTYVIGGFTYSFPGPEAKFYLLKLNSNGNLLWSKIYGGSGYDRCYSVQQTADSGYVLMGSSTGFGAGSYDYYLVKTDSLGNEEWSKTYGGSVGDFGRSVQQTTDGGYFLSGFVGDYGMGIRAMGVVKTFSDGTQDWAKIYGGMGIDQNTSALQTNNNGYIISGTTSSFGGSDMLLIKTDNNGVTEWAKIYLGTSDENAKVQLSSDGGYVICAATGNNFHLIKTNTLGGTGCNENNPATLESVWEDSTTTPGTVVGVTSPTESTITLSVVVTSRSPSTLVLCFSNCAPPAAPTAGTDTAYCDGDPVANLTAIGDSIEWFSDAGLTNLLDTGIIFTPSPAIGTTTYYVTQTVSGCQSPSSSVVIVVNAIPSAPAAGNDTTYCDGDPVADLTAIGASIEWFSDAGLTNLIGTGSPFTITPSIDTTTWYVTQKVSGCQSQADSVMIIVNPLPVIDSVLSTNLTICGANDGTITIFASGGTSPLQYSIDGGGAFTTSGSFTGLSDGNFPVVVSDTNGCSITGSTLIITAPGAPSAPVAGLDATYCDGDTVANLIAVGDSIEWFSDAGLTNLIGSATPFAITPAIGTTIYYVTQTVSGCQSPSSSVVIVVNAIPSAPAAGTDTTYCDGDPVAGLTATGANIEWFSDPGLTTLIGTGSPFAITPVVGTNTWYVIQTVSGCKSPLSAVVITVNAIPSAPTEGTDATYCDGDPVADLTAIGDSIEWFSDTGLTNLIGSGSPFAITPAIGTTVYYVTQSVSGCQSPADSLAITVNPLSIIDSVLSTDLTSCGANDGTITITASGGTPPLQYSIDGGVIFTGSGSFTGLSAGSYPVVVTDTNGCLVIGDTLIITAPGVPPAPVAGSDTIYCDGDLAADLTAIGDSIEWFSDAGLTNQIGTGSPFTPTVIIGTNTFYVTQTVGGCQSPADSVVIIVNSLNIILTSSDPDSTICSGDTITFTASPAGYNNYIFWDGAIPMQVGTTNTYTTTSLLAGNSITVTVVDTASGCTSPPGNAISIIINTAPVSDFSYTVSGLIVDFSDSSSNADSWLWIFGGAGTSNAQNTSITFGQAGTYDVCQIVTNNCGNDTQCDSVTVTTVGIEELAGKNNILFYPNPAKDAINVRLLLKTSYKVKLSILNDLGQEVWSSGQKLDTGQHEINIKTHNLTKGIYFVKIHLNNKESWVGKFLKL